MLIKAISHVHADPLKDEQGTYKRGFPVEVFEDGQGWSPREPLPKFVVVQLPGTPTSVVQLYTRPWTRTLSLTVDSSDLGTDTHTVTVTADTGVSVSGLGALTKAQVEGFLNRWNATVTGFSTNAVTFDVAILDAIQSEAFWEIVPATLALIVFGEVSYDAGTGAHQLTADYSVLLSGMTAARIAKLAGLVQRRVEERGGSVMSNTAGVIEFIILRSDVRAKFFAEVRQKDTHRSVSRRRWVVPAAAMDAISAAGGTVTRTLAQVQAVIHDRMTD